MRTLSINDKTIMLHDEDAMQLAAAGVIYECSDPDHDHDYHTNPEDDSPNGVEDLVLAAVRATHTQVPSLEDAGIETIKLDGVITREIALPMSLDALEKRVAFMQRNLALNVATTALKKGFFETKDRMREDEGVEVSVSLTVIPASKRGSFAYLAKRWIIGSIMALPEVSDQRKAEAIALIQKA